MKREKLIIRLSRLHYLELINTFFLPFVFCFYSYSKNQAIGFNSIIAMTLNGLILLEGSYLWYGIRQQLITGKKHNFKRRFEIFKIMNLALFALALISIALVPFKGIVDKVGTGIFFALAVAEHVNYFEIQLMYDNKSDLSYLFKYGLKKAKLKKKLIEKL